MRPRQGERRRYTDFEHVESLKLDVLTLISKQVHHHFEIGFVGDVLCHDVEIRPVEKDLSQQLQ